MANPMSIKSRYWLNKVWQKIAITKVAIYLVSKFQIFCRQGRAKIRHFGDLSPVLATLLFECLTFRIEIQSNTQRTNVWMGSWNVALNHKLDFLLKLFLVLSHFAEKGNFCYLSKCTQSKVATSEFPDVVFMTNSSRSVTFLGSFCVISAMSSRNSEVTRQKEGGYVEKCFRMQSQSFLHINGSLIFLYFSSWKEKDNKRVKKRQNKIKIMSVTARKWKRS